MGNKDKLGASASPSGHSAEPEPQDVSALRASVLSVTLVEEILGHLGAAKMQIQPTDDRIIADHIQAAHALALALFRGISK